MIKLYIGSELATLGTSSAVLFNYSMTDTENPSVVRNSYTRTVQLPRDPNNERIFGHIGELDRTQLYDGNTTGPGFNHSVKTNFTLYVDGEIYQSGYLKLDKIDNEFFHCTLFGCLGDFFYNLSYKGDTEDDRKTLADLDYTQYGGESELNFKITCDSVNSMWESLTSHTHTDYSTINFIPSYEGFPEGLASDKVLINTNGITGTGQTLEGIVTSRTEDGKVYEAENGFVLATLPGQITSVESRDFRSWTMRPVIKLSKVIEACMDPRNNGGYNVTIDSAFTSGNPYWEKTYITLPRLTEIDWEGDEQSSRRQAAIELPAGGFSGRSTELPIQIQSGDTLYYGGSDSRTEITFKVGFTDTGSTASGVSLYTSASQFGPNYKNITRRCYRSVYIQLLAYSGNTVVSASDSIELTSMVPDKASYARGEDRSYTVGDRELYSQTGTTWLYQPDEHNTNIRRSIGYFNNTGNGVYRWKQGEESRSGGEQYTPITLSIEGGQAFTSLSVRICRDGIDWEDGKYKTPQTYDYVYSQASVSRSDTGFGHYSNEPLHTLDLISADVTFSYGQAVRSGTLVTKKKLLNGEHTPAEYLISFCKIFGLYFYKHPDEKVIEILTRDNFFINTRKNIEDVVDIESLDTSPLTFGNKWLDFGLEGVESGYIQGYNATSQAGYGTRRVNTGYNFNSDPLKVFDGNVYRTAVECLDKSRLYTQITDSILPGYFAGGITYNLWNADESIDVEYKKTTSRNCFQGGDYYDIFPKVQFCSGDLSQVDGRDVIVFFDGFSSGTTQDGQEVWWQVSDDTAEMANIGDGNPVWLYTQSTTYDDRRLCYRYKSIPHFGRFITSGNGITYTLELGIPRQLYFPDITGNSESTVYDRYWKDYVADMYDVDTRKVTAKVRFRERPDENTLRKFFWFENSNWRINEIKEYNPDADELTTVELIKVNDITNYTTNSEPAPVDPVIPRLRLFSPMNAAPDTGGTIMIGVDSNMAWTASTDIGTLDVTTSSDTMYINLTVPRWWETGATADTRVITVTAVGGVSGFSDTIQFTQRLWKPECTANPRLIMVSSDGGFYTSDFKIANYADEVFDVMPGAGLYGYITATTGYTKINDWTYRFTADVQAGTKLDWKYYTGGLFRSSSQQPFFYCSDTVIIFQFPEEFLFDKDGNDPESGLDYYFTLPKSGVRIVAYPSWANITRTEGTSSTTFSITCEQNDGYERESVFIFWSEGTTIKVPVRQLGSVMINPARRARIRRVGNGYVYPEGQELCYTATESAYRVDIEDMGADSVWTVSSDSPWVTVSPSGGTGNGYFTVTASENTGGTPRNAYIKFSSDNDDTEIIVHQSDTKGGAEVIELTQAEYDNLTAYTEDALYVITDADCKYGAEVIELTQAEYDALTAYTEDALYVITDADCFNPDDYYTSAQTNSAITAKTGDLMNYWKNVEDSALTFNNLVDMINFNMTCVISNFQRKPVVLYQTDGTTGLLGINANSIDVTTWQLENLDFSPYKYVKCYIKEADLPLTGTNNQYATPSVVVFIPLDDASKSTLYNSYIGGGGATNMNDCDVHFQVLCAIDGTKTKFKVVSEHSIAGTIKGDRNTNGRYCYKIEGCFD